MDFVVSYGNQEYEALENSLGGVERGFISVAIISAMV